MAAKLPTWFLADDLIGPASLALLDAASKFDPARGVPFRAFARLSVEGACYSAARRNEYRERAHDELTDDASGPTPQVSTAAGSLPPQVWQLPPDQFRVIQLCYQFDLTVERAAARMHISPSKASQHHRAALANLRGLLRKATMKIVDIAKVAHEANRAYCQTIGDSSQPAWEDAPEWQKTSAINGARFHLENPDAAPDHSHDCWLEEKRANGWKYGPVKDPEKKEHPCFVPFDELPPEQQLKDYIFTAVVRAMGEYQKLGANSPKAR